MSKVGGSYESVVRGVSEQVAQDRRSGQCAVQTNFISDPVRGLARRWGTVWNAEQYLGAGRALAQYGADAAKMREFTFTIDGNEYCVIYRAEASTGPDDHFMFCYSKDTNAFMPVVAQPGSPFVNALIKGGVSAITSVGRYLYIAGNNNIATFAQQDTWGADSNQRLGAIWVKVGAYSRTYAVTIGKNDGTSVTASYTTKPSSYPVLLDTSDIPFYLPLVPPATTPTPDPAYQKNINDRTYAYNSAVTKYIGDAAKDITPENIAFQLASQLIANGVSAVSNGSHVFFDQLGMTDITTSDGGDGSSMLGVGNEVDNLDKLSVRHYVGKVVRIRPTGASSKEAYYMEAYAKNDGASGTQEVIWREAPGVLQTPRTMWSMGVFSGGKLVIAQDPASLSALTGDDSHPQFKPNAVGDDASCPVPNFYGNRITLLTVFQDRLVVGSNNVVTCSRPGDYLNFYRHTVLNIQDDDPVEMFSYGAEGDVLRYSALFDRDLVLFGDQKQYTVSGRSVLTPKAPNIAVMSAHEYTTQAEPQSSGNLVFYGKQREGRTSVHQLQVGQLTESPESFEVSQQLDTYLHGKPAQIVALTSPNTIVFRTEDVDSNLYIYNYVDTPAGSERLLDSWSKWTFAQVLGATMAVSSSKGELLVFSMRDGADGLYVVADRQTLSTTLSPRPYMDSMRPAQGITSGWHAVQARSTLSAALDNTHTGYLFGASWDKAPALVAQLDAGAASAMWVGAWDMAIIVPTNPYVRDQNGKSVLDGRLTLTSVTVSLSDTSGLVARVVTTNGQTEWPDFIGRLTGNPANVIGRQPVVSSNMVVGIGAETRECSYTIESKNWLPITITALGWTGQYFNRVRRV